jgi:hypothetical protein
MTNGNKTVNDVDELQHMMDKIMNKMDIKVSVDQFEHQIHQKASKRDQEFLRLEVETISDLVK